MLICSYKRYAGIPSYQEEPLIDAGRLVFFHQGKVFRFEDNRDNRTHRHLEVAFLNKRILDKANNQGGFYTECNT